MNDITNTVNFNIITRRTYVPARLSEAETLAFEASGWCAIAFVGPLEIVPRQLGDTEGLAPIAPRLSSDWADRTSSQLDRASPFCAQGLLFRVWFEAKADAKRLLIELPAFFSAQAAKLRGDWYGLPAAVDLVSLQVDLFDFANGRGLSVFDDEAVVKTLRAQGLAA